MESQLVADRGDSNSSGSYSFSESGYGGCLPCRYRSKENAFSTIIGEFEGYRQKLHSAAMRILNNYHDAEDVVQDTYLRAVRNINKFNSSLSAYNWLYTITLNLSKNKLRYERVRGSHGDSWSNSLDEMRIEAPVREEVDAMELQEMIESAKSMMTPSHMQILQLRVSEGMAYAAISHRLGIQVGTVRSRISRAKRELARQIRLQDLCDDYSSFSSFLP